jgi:hypothetical protein
MEVQDRNSVAHHSRRGRDLLVGVLLVLAPVLLFVPVRMIVVYAPTVPWANAIAGTGYLANIMFELWGLGRLMKCLTKKIDVITVCAVLASLLALSILGFNIKWLAYLIKYL